MSLPIDAAPPGHVPPASASPYPLQPPPHGASATDALPVRPSTTPEALSLFAKAVIGGVAAAAIALGVALPLLVRGRSPQRKRARAHP